ncbi:MAG: sensor histidine kinase [Candidatus Kryptoniota bacterium]
MNRDLTVMRDERLPLFEDVKDLAGFKLDRENRVASWNVGAERLMGYVEGEIRGSEFLSFFSDDSAKSEFNSFFEKSKKDNRFEIETWLLGKNDRKFWAEVTVTPIFSENNELTGHTVIILDLSARKMADDMLLESEKQLRALATHLQAAREEERTRIAREMHDEFGQMLTAVRMDLSILERMISKTVKEPLSRMSLVEKISSISELLEKTIRSTRRIITELRPAVLDELGLLTAIQWQALEFENRTGIRCRIARLQHDMTLDQESSTSIFRILQEALTNAAKHASPSNVTITLQVTGENLVLEISDDGEGMEEGKQKDPTSTGLTGIRERVIALNGKFNISSRRGEGTTLTVSIPYKPSLEIK